MRVIVFSDLHLEQGYPLGSPEEELENTRMRDAAHVLNRIAQQDADILIFGGDVGATATPKPTAVRLMQKFLADFIRGHQEREAFLLDGNHDFRPAKTNVLDTIAAGHHGRSVVHTPVVVEHGDLQIGFLPWTPPSRMLSDGAQTKEDANRAATAALLAVEQGLRAQIDPRRPSLLVAHWMLAGSNMPSGGDLMQISEPILPVHELEAGPWSAIVAGHNHQAQQVGPRTWVCGPPMRTSWGEESLQPSYMLLEWDAAGQLDVRYCPTDDRPLSTIRCDTEQVGRWLDGEADLADLLNLLDPDSYREHVVRVILEVSDQQCGQITIDGRAREILDVLAMQGAAKVVGPQLEVQTNRERRTEVKVEIDPLQALGQWLDTQKIDGDLRDRVQEQAPAIINTEVNL